MSLIQKYYKRFEWPKYKMKSQKPKHEDTQKMNEIKAKETKSAKQKKMSNIKTYESWSLVNRRDKTKNQHKN